MPIAIFEIPRTGHLDAPQAKELCDKAGNCLHGILGVPDPEDKESRVTRSVLDKAILRMSFTIGPNEYPDFEPGSFFPTAEQIESAGQSVLRTIKDSRFYISQVVIEAWENTTFVLREGKVAEPTPPMSEEALREIGRHLCEPRVKLVLSPQRQMGASFSKELGLSSETEGQEVTLRLASRIAEIFGYEKPIAQETEFTQAADTDVSVEFDCETESNTSIPEEVRKYLAESSLY